MKPVAFDYERPTSMDAAIKLLGDESLFCKVLAGSQSLGPMLKSSAGAAGSPGRHHIHS